MKCSIEASRFEEVASCLADAVIVTDKKGRIRWCNEAFTKLCGYNAQEVKGQIPGRLLQGKGTDLKTIEAIHHALNEGKYFRTEILNYHKKGHPYWVSISIAPIRKSSGQIDGFIAIERDITSTRSEIMNMEEQVVQLYTTVVSSQKTSPSHSNQSDPFHMARIN